MNWEPGKNRPLPAEALGQWRGRVERADLKRKTYEDKFGWDRALERYTKSKASQYDVNALLDFRHVESKKAQLFYQTPEISLLPIEPAIAGVPSEQILPLRQKVLNHKLGPDGDNVKAEIHEALFDALAPSGFLCTKIGYENVTVSVEVEQPVMFNPLAKPEKVKVEVPIWERCFWSRFSPKKLLIPDDFTSTKYDRAPWLGVKGTMPLSQAKRLWTLPKDFTATAHKDESVFTHGDSQADTGDPLVEYEEIWYRAALFDETVQHPELFRCLILVKGLDEPVKHVDSPYQTIGPDGRLTDDSMIGNPIHIGTLRDLSDSAYVQSDLSVGEQLSNEVNQFRTSQVRGRRKRSPIVLVAESLGQPTVDKITANEGPVMVPDQFIDSGGSQRAVAVAQTGTEPRDNFTAQDYIERDFEKALGVSANQSGQFTKSKRTATEARIVQGNSDARAENERDRLREYFVAGVRKYDCLLQRYMTQRELVKILGAEGAQIWEQWRALPGKYGYKVQPDSGVHVDATQYRSQTLDEYNLLRKDDRVNTDELLKKVARALGYDPAKFVAPPVDKTMEPPTATLALKGENLSDPVAGRLFLDLLANGGVKISEDTIALMKAVHTLQGLLQSPTGQPGAVGADVPQGHGGSANRTEPVNQHAREKTGGIQGVGAAA